MPSVAALKLAGDMAMAYPGRNVTEEHAVAWAGVLDELPENVAADVAARIVGRSSDPPSLAALRQAVAETTGKTMSPDYYGGGWRCTFADGIECPACGVIHGHLIDAGELLHGAVHLGKALDGDREHLGAARYPEQCDCGFESPENVNALAVIDLVAKDVARARKARANV